MSEARLSDPHPPAGPSPGRCRSRVGRSLGALAPVVAVLATACAEPPSIPAEYFRTPTPHEAQRLSIRERGLDTTALGREWLTEAERALNSPLAVGSPYAEAGRFVRPEADAVGYRIRVERGQRLEIRLDGELVRSAELLVDLFRTAPHDPGRHAWIGSLPVGAGRMDLEPEATTDYLLRLQPALFAEGDYELTIRTVSALAFPVLGRDGGAVWSEFGAPREGGRRQHHGVDIFAPRGTPVIAATEAVVRRVDETPVGGRVVWLRDRRRGRSLYYAHLDSQTVRDGQWVAQGDTIGLVGNSGNARTTPPHLHFGLYARGEGPIDPLPFIRIGPSEIPPVLADAGRSGTWSRTRSADTRLRARPSGRSDVVARIGPDRPFRIVAASAGWYRVRLPGGSEGYVAERVTEAVDAVRIAEDGAASGGGSPGSSGTSVAGAARTSDRVEDLR